MRIAALMLGAALAAGCSNLFHSDAKPEQTYVLRAPGPADAPAGTAGTAGTAAPAATAAPLAELGSIQVLHPIGAPGLDGPHIILVQADHRMNFYVGSRWVAPAADVVESFAVQTLRASGAWTSVEDSASPFPSDYLLAIDLRRFEADYTAGGALPVVHVVLECIVGRREGRDVVATFVAAGDAPAAANRMSGVVAAFEQASTAAMDVLAQQALQAVRADLQRAAQNPASPAPSSKR
jgi:cholesterol transport system auxiliary component